MMHHGQNGYSKPKILVHQPLRFETAYEEGQNVNQSKRKVKRNGKANTSDRDKK